MSFNSGMAKESHKDHFGPVNFFFGKQFTRSVKYDTTWYFEG